ncbi:MAG: indolepyruvate ferredoxin oxidoreductase subunit alpha [Clostridiales bacterium]|nr:indolepyruvate ferredoxin oxidoreductase subunit alpha [Clostridiales bacterium]
MHREFVMGNEAIALGALAAGVNLVAGYPGTPSTEVLETVSARRTEATYVEWSVNEKAGMEVAAGAAYAGARSMVTMKQVGLNVASDPLMSLAYIGVKGGMVVMVADDPGPISSQTEQDTRTFAAYSKLPVFDPTGVQEAYDMIQEAFAFSEKHHTPVLFRPTTRICHGYASIDVKDPEDYVRNNPEGFVKGPNWVIFPRLSFANHKKIEERNVAIGEEFSSYARNVLLPASGTFSGCRKGIATHGISFDYTMENLEQGNSPRLLKIVTPFPFPEQLAVEFLNGLDEVLCIEELDPVIERALIYVCGKYHLNVKICGKLTGHVASSGENSIESVAASLKKFFGSAFAKTDIIDISDAPPLPVRPPVLCAGCPHRAAFYAVKCAAKGQKALYSGDIGCYTLGNAMPLDMTDTCLCMGAGITLAQGIGRIEPDTLCFSFTGDSTFFASGMTGIVNAFYNQANMTAVILDNSTTAMTGHQPHPGTGKTMMGEIVEKVSIEKVLHAIGLETVETVNPLDLPLAIETVKRVSAQPGVKAIIFRSPCVAITRPKGCAAIDPDACINCKRCIRELGCPGIVLDGGTVAIDPSLCTGCGLCAQVCPVHAIENGGVQNE